MKLLSPLFIFCALALAGGQSPATAVDASPTQPEIGPEIGPEIDRLVRDLIDTYQTPGVAVALVQGGQVIHAKGYGLRHKGLEASVDTSTYFRVASVSKAFTVAALAVLADEGKLDWDDRVVEFLPDFQMSDPWVTREFTIRDLLTHRSGLGPGAGDLMLWPAPTGFSRQEIVHNLRHLRPVSSFRSEYAYDNLLYIVAGELIETITGVSWEAYVQERLLKPLGNNCYTETPSSVSNVAMPHQMLDDTVVTVPRNAVHGPSPVYAAAGGISCNIKGLADWMRTWLAGGTTPSGVTLFSLEQRKEMWEGVTLMSPTSFERNFFGSHFKTYALAWRKLDVMGQEFISHTGSLSGARAWVGFLPDMEIGIAILDNGNNSKVRNILMTALLSRFAGKPGGNWIDRLEDWYETKRQERAALKAEAMPEAEGPGTEGDGTVFLPLAAYAGTYKDSWFGHVDITLDGDTLRFASRKSPQMIGSLEPFSGHRFIVRWDNRKLEADAWVKFGDDFTGQITGMQMKAVSDETDSSFDFEDLGFVRQDPQAPPATN